MAIESKTRVRIPQHTGKKDEHQHRNHSRGLPLGEKPSTTDQQTSQPAIANRPVRTRYRASSSTRDKRIEKTSWLRFRLTEKPVHLACGNLCFSPRRSASQAIPLQPLLYFFALADPGDVLAPVALRNMQVLCSRLVHFVTRWLMTGVSAIGFQVSHRFLHKP